MKKLILLFLVFSLVSCNDGDFDIPAFEFTEAISSCGEYVLFKKNSEISIFSVFNMSPGTILPFYS